MTTARMMARMVTTVELPSSTALSRAIRRARALGGEGVCWGGRRLGSLASVPAIGWPTLGWARRRAGVVLAHAGCYFDDRLRGARACHEQAELLDRDARRPLTGDLALIHDDDAICEGIYLIELGRADEHGGAMVAGRDDLVVDELDRTDVQPAGRLVGDEKGHITTELSSDDDLLLVTSREGPDRHVDRGGPDVVVLHVLGGALADGV